MKKTNAMRLAVIGAVVVAVGAGAVVMALRDKGSETETAAEDEGDVNPLTGIVLEEGESLPDRPIMVSTDNDSYLSQPQSGISLADILIEVPIEGGGSRYEPIYYSNIDELELVGAIRSTRPYMLDIAREYNAVFVHNGQSPQAIDYFEESGVDRVSAFEYYAAFHNESDKNGRLPGNQYSTGEDILSAMSELGYTGKKEVRTFPWLEEGEKVAGNDATEITVNYADGADNTFVYDPETKLYTRYVRGQELVDDNNGQVFTCANILVQKVPFNLYTNEDERLQIDMYAGGEAVMFTQGKVVEGTWERKDKDSPTIFRDKDGNEFKMTPGVTAIELIDTTVEFDY